MNTLLAELKALQNVLVTVVATAPTGTMDSTGIDPFIRAMSRKCKFAKVHLRLLDAVPWDRIDGLGREAEDGKGPEYLSVLMPDARLEVRHPDAVVDHVYIALDGVVAAVANLTDTFGRMINQVYRLQIDPNRASLFAVRDQCSATSPLGQVLREPQHVNWLKCVRELRGRCQHADIDEILATPGSRLGSRSEPLVPARYCWQAPFADTGVAAFGKLAAQQVSATLVAASTAIRSQPHSPHA